MIWSLVTIQSATTTLANIGEYSSPFFAEFVPYMLVSAGVLIGAMIAVWIIRVMREVTGVDRSEKHIINLTKTEAQKMGEKWGQ